MHSEHTGDTRFHKTSNWTPTWKSPCLLMCQHCLNLAVFTRMSSGWVLGVHHAVTVLSTNLNPMCSQFVYMHSTMSIKGGRVSNLIHTSGEHHWKVTWLACDEKPVHSAFLAVHWGSVPRAQLHTITLTLSTISWRKWYLNPKYWLPLQLHFNWAGWSVY